MRRLFQPCQGRGIEPRQRTNTRVPACRRRRRRRRSSSSSSPSSQLFFAASRYRCCALRDLPSRGWYHVGVWGYGGEEDFPRCIEMEK